MILPPNARRGLLWTAATAMRRRPRVAVIDDGGGDPGGGDPEEPLVPDYYLSPSGSNSNNGLTTATPWKTFAKAFSTMGSGKILGLMDGTYSIAAGTGVINFEGTGSAQPPNGSSKTAPTIITAVNDGGAILDGTGDYLDNAIFLGRSSSRAQYIKIIGVKTHSDVTLYHTYYCFIKNTGVRGSLGIGTNDVDGSGITLPNTYNLIEDCWAWCKDRRLIASNYQAHTNIWRRVVVRGDGCSTGECTGSGNPNVGITIYNSHRVHFQNVFVVDRILGGGSPYADFACAQHDGVNADKANFYYGDNWLKGCLSFKAPDSAVVHEADTTDPVLTPHFNYRDSVALFAVDEGFNIAPATFGPNARRVSARNLTSIGNGGNAFRLRNFTGGGSELLNSIGADNGLYGSNTDGVDTVDHLNLYNNANGNTGTTPTNIITLNPRSGSNRALLYPLRVEAGSPNKGTGAGGADIGANIVYKWGTDGTFYGDTGWDTLTSDPLWPYPNETRMRTEMQTTTGGTSVSRGFCAVGETFTHYLWNAFGNGSPY